MIEAIRGTECVIWGGLFILNISQIVFIWLTLLNEPLIPNRIMAGFLSCSC